MISPSNEQFQNVLTDYKINLSSSIAKCEVAAANENFHDSAVNVAAAVMGAINSSFGVGIIVSNEIRKYIPKADDPTADYSAQLTSTLQSHANELYDKYANCGDNFTRVEMFQKLQEAANPKNMLQLVQNKYACLSQQVTPIGQRIVIGGLPEPRFSSTELATIHMNSHRYYAVVDRVYGSFHQTYQFRNWVDQEFLALAVDRSKNEVTHLHENDVTNISSKEIPVDVAYLDTNDKPVVINMSVSEQSKPIPVTPSGKTITTATHENSNVSMNPLLADFNSALLQHQPYCQ